MRPCIHDGRVCQARLKLTTFCFSYRGTSPGFAFYLLFSWSPAHAFTLATGVSTHLSILQPIFYWILIPWIMAGSEHFFDPKFDNGLPRRGASLWRSAMIKKYEFEI